MEDRISALIVALTTICDVCVKAFDARASAIGDLGWRCLHPADKSAKGVFYREITRLSHQLMLYL